MRARSRVTTVLFVAWFLALLPQLAAAQTQLTVNGSAGAVTVSAGVSLTLDVSASPGHATDWVALHAAGAPDTSYLDWRYLSGTTTPPPTGVTAASIRFHAPVEPGTYEFRLHPNNGLAVAASSGLITVTAPTAQLLINGTGPPTTVAVGPGNAVTVAVSGGPGLVGDWVGLYPVGAPDQAPLRYQYLNGSTSMPTTGVTAATLLFVGPTSPGSYEYRFFHNNGYTRLATSTSLVVATPSAQIAVNGVVPPTSVSVTPGALATVTLSGGPGNATDWVGLYATGAPDTPALDWRYLSGTTVPPATALTAATFGWSLPTTAGTYEFRFFAANTYARVATSAVVTVPSPVAQLTVNGIAPPAAVSALPGSVATVTVSGGPANPTDWVALYPVGAADTAHLGWQYLSGTTAAPPVGTASAELRFTLPTVPGTYELRLFAHNGFGRLATSAPITVPVSPARLAVNGVPAPTTVAVAPGATVAVHVTDGPANATDWVGLAPAGAPETTVLAWQYLNASTTPPSVGSSNATLSFTLPSAPGAYEFRLFANGGYGRLATATVSTIASAAPTLTVLSPAVGRVGTVVTLIGTDFGAAPGTVHVNGTLATPTAWAPHTITVAVPEGATSGDVIVTVAGQASNPVPFIVTPGPTLTSVSPTAGPVGTVVTLTGIGFGTTPGSSTVRFNGTVATPITWSPQSVTVPVPAGATSGDVTVTVSGDTSNAVPFAVTPAPTLTRALPVSGSVGTLVTLTGTGFGSAPDAAVVRFNGLPSTALTGTATTIVVPVPEGATSGPVTVTVLGQVSNPLDFAVPPDTDGPTIVPTYSSAPNAAGWHRTPVTVTFECADPNTVLSCPSPVLFDQAGSNPPFTVTASDRLGNQRSLTLAVRLDLVPPTVTLTAPNEDLTTTEPALAITAQVTDAVSGVVSATCSGEPAVISNGMVSCTVPLQPGVNPVVVAALDAAGHSTSHGVRVTRTGAPTRLTIMPATRALTVGEAFAFAVTSEFAPVTDVVWTSSDPTVLSVATDGSGVVTAASGGVATLTATYGALSAQATVTVGVSGLAPGAVRWRGPAPAPGTYATWMIPARPIDDHGPDLFTVEPRAADGPYVIQSLSADGRTLATETTALRPLFGDEYGGLLATSETATTLARLATSGSQRPWAYHVDDATSYLSADTAAQGPDGTVYVVETRGTEADVVGLDGQTGHPTLRVRLPGSTSTLRSQGCTTDFSLWYGPDGTSQSAPSIGPITIGSDGAAYVQVSESHDTWRPVCVWVPGSGDFDSLDSNQWRPGLGTRAVQTRTQLLRISHTGAATATPLFTWARIDPDLQDPNAPPWEGGYPGSVIPDSLGGVLATWYHWDGTQTTTRVARVTGGSLVADQVPPPAAGAFGSIALVADGTAYFADGSQTAAVDVQTWSTTWTRSGTPVVGVSGRQVVLQDATAGQLARVGPDGTVVESIAVSGQVMTPAVVIHNQGSLHGIDAASGAVIEVRTASFAESLSYASQDRTRSSGAEIPLLVNVYKGLEERDAPYTYSFEGSWQSHWKDGVNKAVELWNAKLAETDVRIRFVKVEGSVGNIRVVRMVLPGPNDAPTLGEFPRPSAGSADWATDGQHLRGGELRIADSPYILTELGYRKVAMHEIGHALGLAHAHATGTPSAPPPKGTTLMRNLGIGRTGNAFMDADDRSTQNVPDHVTDADRDAVVRRAHRDR